MAVDSKIPVSGLSLCGEFPGPASPSASQRVSALAEHNYTMATFASSGIKKENVAVVTPAVKAIAGSMGGMMEACCLQPIDVIKTRLQLDRTGQYRGIGHCGNTIIQQEGVKALWKGLTPFATHLTLKYALRMVRSEPVMRSSTVV
eukprot:1190985-Prorocentrum_minimum.AAC.1